MRPKKEQYLYALIIVASLAIIGLTLYLLAGSSELLPELKISNIVVRIHQSASKALSDWMIISAK